MIINVHSHINSNDYSSLEKQNIIKICQDKNITCFITGTNLEDSQEAIDLSNNNDMMYNVIGIYPGEVDNIDDNTINSIKKMINAKTVALGEIGLDYHYGKENMAKQKKVFIEQLDLARELKLPVVIHCRDAYQDVYDIVKNYQDISKVFHCYGGSLEMAKEFVKINSYLSFGGVITFKNAKKAVAVVKNIPLEYLLVETDDPYLTPAPFRGKQNKAYYVEYVVNQMASIKETSVKLIEETTVNTARKIFGVK